MTLSQAIKTAAKQAKVDPRRLRQAAEHFTISGFCRCEEQGDAVDLDELAGLLAEKGGDVESTVALGHALLGEFGYIPEDIHCVAEGGQQVMFLDIHSNY